MRATAIFVAFSALALAACNPAAPGGGAAGGGLFPTATASSYRIEAVLTHEDGSTMPLVLVRDGQKQRMELNGEEGSSIIISNGETGESFTIVTMNGQTVAMRSVADAALGALDPSQDWRAELAATATRTGGCSGAGQSGSEWTNTKDGAVQTICITEDGIILAATAGGRAVWQTTQVRRGGQPADQFTLPPGVQVVDMGNAAAMRDMFGQSGQ